MVLYVSTGFGGFLPAMKQIGNVAALPGIVNVCGFECPAIHLKLVHKHPLGYI